MTLILVYHVTKPVESRLNRICPVGISLFYLKYIALKIVSAVGCMSFHILSPNLGKRRKF